jgi:hypothetical protein
MKILIFILIPFLIFGSTLYVDNYAPDSGDGTINNPFCSLNQAFNRLQPGDTLILRGSNTAYGQIYFEDLDLPFSGLAKKEITLMNYKNEVVVISIINKFCIDEHYWNFKGIIFEDLKSKYSKIDFSGKNNNFYNCIFRTSSIGFFDQGKENNNQFKFCKIEN